MSVASNQTAVCQNNCSGHGVCDQATRQCLCEAFWMQDLIAKHLGSGDSNCDWSILYVVIVLFTGVVLIVGGGWGIICLCQRACTRRPRKRQKYALLGDDGEDDAMIPRVSQGKIMLSDTDSDSESVLYESGKCKLNGESRNGHGKPRNGFVKSGRRIKT
ncbi:Dyslexia-associated protein KIAA0319-like protein [Gryllus bimaculatus]|nr:Dyslexia-associated protein KIAA0319-like protein [Gryllus bimaculatus]